MAIKSINTINISNNIPLSNKNQSKKINNSDLTDDQRLEIKEAFDLFDQNNKNSIKASDLKIALRALNFECDKQEVDKLLDDIEKKEESDLNFEEFSEILTLKMLERDPLEEIKKNFKLICDENNIISFDTLKKTAEEFSENINISDEDLKEIISETASNKFGITEEDFIKIMKDNMGLNLNSC